MQGIENYDDLERFVTKYGGWDRIVNLWFNNSIVSTFGIEAFDASPGKVYNKDTEPVKIFFDPDVNYDKEFNVVKWYVRDIRGYPALTTRTLALLEGIDFLPPEGKLEELDIRIIRS